MSRSKNVPNEATEQDLSWFGPDKYSGLTNFTALDWARLVGDRLAIRRAIDGGNPEAVMGVFDTLKETPLKSLGSDVRYIGANHAANTATVKSMNVRRLGFLADELASSPAFIQATAANDFDDEASKCQDAVVDELLAGNPETSFQRFAHVMVSIDAPRDRVIADFERWLDGWLATGACLPEFDYRNGDYMEKAKNQWIPHCAVQFYDLDLFECLSGRSVPSAFRWRKLFPDVRFDALESKKKNARSAAELLFSEDTYSVLRHLAYDSSSAQAPRSPTSEAIECARKN